MNGTQERQETSPMVEPPRYGAPRDPRRKSPALAAVLSIGPGLGQIYVGYYQRGFVHAIVVAGIIGVLSNMNDFSPLIPALGLFLPFFWIYNIIDAWRRASFYNHALSGLEPMELPSDFAMPGAQGSIFGGVALLLGGLILLSHTAFGVSLWWLEDWWPLAPMGLGIYLVVKALRDRGSVG